MKDLTVYKNDEFGTVRILTIDGEPYFVGKDVTEILGYSNSRDALAKHVDNEVKIPSRFTTVFQEILTRSSSTNPAYTA